MRTWQVFRLKLRALLRGGTVDRDDREEMESHLEHLTQEFIEQGDAPPAARARALRAFGGVSQLQEQARDAHGRRGMATRSEGSWTDPVVALRAK